MSTPKLCFGVNIYTAKIIQNCQHYYKLIYSDDGITLQNDRNKAPDMTIFFFFFFSNKEY